MTKAQSVKTLGAVAFVAQIFIFQACGSNSPSNMMPGTGNTTGQGQAGTSGTGTAGTTGAGGTAGTSEGGSIGTGTAGTTGAGGTEFGQPTCPSTVAKGGACAATDIQFCYKTCGPEKAGVKSETCQTSGTYSEMSGCTFDQAKDFSCYKLPAAADPTCPAGMTPKASDPCTADMCHACNSMQGVAGGQYLDSSGAAKSGFCVCQAANASGARVWSCATDNGSWPCPGNPGCG
ncbi:MAG TPA: hypothetical protein VIF57_02570 [Polyangia bacterium]|jgi:hypothetical protein